MAERKKLTTKQEQIIARRGMFVVKACPGSGKTFAVAARLAHLLRDWRFAHRGVATISFTNVAWQEIDQVLSKDFGVSTPVPYPHFLGTIDSFLNQYIFLPFGHHVMGCSRRPELIGPPVNNWEPIGSPYAWGNGECYRRECKLNQFSYDLSGNLINVLKSRSGIFRQCPRKHDRCLSLKAQLVEGGYATQRDAAYFAMRVLEEYPSVAKAIVARFPFLMMDEAQDTSAIEMAVVELLIRNGLREVMLIGDPEQAIFEWRDAQPDLLQAKYTEWQNNSLMLDENWRSSQRICDFFHRMSSLSDAPRAVNPEVSLCEDVPQIWAYQGDEYEAIVNRFVTLCASGGIVPQAYSLAVLPRSRDVIRSILGDHRGGGVREPWHNVKGDITRSVCEARHLLEQGEFRRAMEVLAKAVCTKIRQKDHCTTEELRQCAEEYGRVQWRQDLYRVLKALPEMNSTVGDWIERAKANLHTGWLVEPDDISIKTGKGKDKDLYAQMDIRSFFVGAEPYSASRPYRLGTIHSAKGETIDAVLVVLKEHAGDRHKYELMLGQPIIENEELRVVYVGITRARRILVLAVPEVSRKAWERKFFGR
jgi:DNA helicase-2/ATP-dependent DNA helicase PcrA